MDDTKVPFKMCPSCAEEVYTYSAQVDGGIEVRCSACGFPLSLEAGPPPQALDCIVVADDDRFFRTLLTDLLGERRAAISVIPCESGTEFLTVAAERFREGLPIKVGILDIKMRPLDGFSAALALRALERGLKVSPPTPVVFLSAVPSDESLKRLVNLCQPALYLNKGAGATPEELGPRLEKVIRYLVGQRG